MLRISFRGLIPVSAALLAVIVCARVVAAAPEYRSRTEGVDPDRIGIRFLPETGARVRDGRLVSITGADLGAVASLVASLDGATLERRFPRSEAELERYRRMGAERTRQAVPDLNLFALLTLPPAAGEAEGRARLRDVLERLNDAPGVAEAWALPKPEVAGFLTPGAPAGPINTSRGGVGVLQPARSDTPDFSPLQGYLYEPPVGVWADSVWGFSGGQGQGVKMIDMEFGWLFAHEDLKAPWYYGGPPAEADHGTAVLGEFGGQHNGFGIQGIAPEMDFGAIYVEDLASAITEAIGVLSPGDLFLIEIQITGPYGYMPMEWVPDVFAAISNATALGIICIEAGANGSVDLDDPYYEGLFDRRVRDSRAIMVGAGTPQGLDAEWFTDYGSRMSLQGWGSSIVTTCCGDLQGGDPTVQYTAGFNGTSGASPIVTGSVASLQGQALALFGAPLTPALAEEILGATGSPYNGSKPIGERPNLAAARERLLRGYGDVLVTVRDGTTLEPMPGMIVSIPETGRLHQTGPGGQIAMQMTAGDVIFHVSGNFFYSEADFPFTVQAGQEQEAVLDVFRAPTGELAGTVRDQRGAPLEGARVLIKDTPLDTSWTDAGGGFAIHGIPADTGYTAIASQVPGYGAAARFFDLAAGDSVSWQPCLVDAQTFENGPAGYTTTGEFELGLPTFPPNPLPVPFSGENCWGTNLDGYYADLTTSTLTSPVFHLAGTTRLTLTFYHWYWIDSDDGGQVQVWDADQGQWVTVRPIGDYPDQSIIILLYGPGYNGRQTSWEPAIFPLDDWAGGDFRFRFLFKSNYQGHKVGWLIDDVALDTGQGAATVDLSAFQPGEIRLLPAAPNPSSGIVNLRFMLPRAGNASVEVFSPSGARIRSLHLGPVAVGTHDAFWDGRDDSGRLVGSGLYLYRLTAGGRSAEGRLVHIR